MLGIEGIKLSAMPGFALCKEPIYFLRHKNRYYRQVFYNPSSDYGYWRLEKALEYTSYINSEGNMQDWNPKSNKFLLFYDMNAPTYWKDYKYLLFVTTKGNDADRYSKTFDKKIYENTKELVNCSYQIGTYNKKRIIANELFHKSRELAGIIVEYKRHQEWLIEEWLMVNRR